MTKVIIVMPAYRAERTLAATHRALPPVYDEVILCDDGSEDRTHEVSRSLGITTIRHRENAGYGANQKTLYDAARKKNPDVIVMVHPDNQYDTRCLPEMIRAVQGGAALVLGTRMGTALRNDMPVWKYAGNRLLTALQNRAFRSSLSEFHSGLRVYDARLFARMPYRSFSDDFVFDSEVIAWLMANGYGVTEVPAECFYRDGVSSVNLSRSVTYGLSTLMVLLRFLRGRYRDPDVPSS